MSNFTLFKKGLKNGTPIFLGYLAVSFTFGIAARNSGISSLQAIIISATNLTSAGQFAALGVELLMKAMMSGKQDVGAVFYFPEIKELSDNLL